MTIRINRKIQVQRETGQNLWTTISYWNGDYKHGSNNGWKRKPITDGAYDYTTIYMHSNKRQTMKFEFTNTEQQNQNKKIKTRTFKNYIHIYIYIYKWNDDLMGYRISIDT